MSCHLTQMCLRKQAFRSKDEAAAQIDRWKAMGRGAEALVAYTCGACGSVHVGHRRGTKKR